MEFETPYSGSAYSSTNVAIIEHRSNAHDDYLITPQITVTSATSDQLRFYGKNYSSYYTEEFNIITSPTGTAAGDFTTTLDGPIAPPTSWTEYVYDLSA